MKSDQLVQHPCTRYDLRKKINHGENKRRPGLLNPSFCLRLWFILTKDTLENGPRIRHVRGKSQDKAEDARCPPTTITSASLSSYLQRCYLLQEQTEGQGQELCIHLDALP